MQQNYLAPQSNGSSFTCPHCGVLARQEWLQVYRRTGRNTIDTVKGVSIATCDHCSNKTLFIEDVLVFPMAGNAPLPHPDLPSNIKTDYLEARDIAVRSPRGAAALLRLCIQKLCVHLGEKGKDLNQDIAHLVKKGLPVLTQQALDYVRVIGNNAVHPGYIDLADDNETIANLFPLINIIAETMISQPKLINELYTSLPVDKRTAIENRDKR